MTEEPVLRRALKRHILGLGFDEPDEEEMQRLVKRFYKFEANYPGDYSFSRALGEQYRKRPLPAAS